MDEWMDAQADWILSTFSLSEGTLYNAASFGVNPWIVEVVGSSKAGRCCDQIYIF
jgi:hypothetical protein